MKRLVVEPRTNWIERVESVGFHFHSLDGQPYWDESVCYAFEMDEILQLERATRELQARCIEAVDIVIRRGWLNRFQIPERFHEYVVSSWEQDEPSLYGRFDLAFGGDESGRYRSSDDLAPKMLEYNADTPTSLLEASVVQWYWLEETRPGKDQFNSIHERLIDAWRWFGEQVGKNLHVAGLGDSLEDFMTMTYLRDTAEQAGLRTSYLDIDGIGWKKTDGGGMFVGLNEEPITACFKLYPWEWMVKEEFAPMLLKAGNRVRWIEPAWKMLLSNKAILPILWELFPGHPNLLPASFENNLNAQEVVRKPLLSREGANVRISRGKQVIAETEGTYGGPWIYQKKATLCERSGHYAVIGSWIIGGEAAGIGIREDASMVTGNFSRFVPHFIE